MVSLAFPAGRSRRGGGPLARRIARSQDRPSARPVFRHRYPRPGVGPGSPSSTTPPACAHGPCGLGGDHRLFTCGRTASARCRCRRRSGPQVRLHEVAALATAETALAICSAVAVTPAEGDGARSTPYTWLLPQHPAASPGGRCRFLPKPNRSAPRRGAPAETAADLRRDVLEY